MKKTLFILFIFFIGCTKPELPLPQVTTVSDVFSVKENTVTNGQPIHFNLPSIGSYTLTLTNKETGQVISRERFNGQIGENIRNIYTNSLDVQYLYLILEDDTKKEINKTTIVIKK